MAISERSDNTLTENAENRRFSTTPVLFDTHARENLVNIQTHFHTGRQKL